MSFLETFVDELEAQELAEELFHSIYYVPPEYQPLESPLQ